MATQVKVGIIGGAGYTGGELLRLLLNHPNSSISFIHSNSNTGKPVYAVHEDLQASTDLFFSGELKDDIDVLFLCTGHGEGKKFIELNELNPHVKVISLSQDFRLNEEREFRSRNFVYGLPEVNRDKIREAKNIANPGCFATAVQLGLLPLAAKKILTDVYATGITGSTGAGQSLSATSHFSWRQNNIQAYKTLSHQHLGEIGETLQQISGAKVNLNFVPWRGDFARGIFVSSQLKCDLPLDEVEQLYREYFQDHPFTLLSNKSIFMKQVVNTNNCIVHLEKEGEVLVVHSAIDNLLKGASGQALQNMNLMFGLDETAGLRLKANYF